MGKYKYLTLLNNLFKESFPQCKCGEKALFYCNLKTKCSEGSAYYCTEDSCMGKHEHRARRIVHMISSKFDKWLSFVQKLKNILNSVPERYNDIEPLITLLEQTAFRVPLSEITIVHNPISQDYRELLKLCKDTIELFNTEINALFLSNKLEQLIDREKTLNTIKEQFERLSYLSQLEMKHLWDCYNTILSNVDHDEASKLSQPHQLIFQTLQIKQLQQQVRELNLQNHQETERKQHIISNESQMNEPSTNNDMINKLDMKIQQQELTIQQQDQQITTLKQEINELSNLKCVVAELSKIMEAQNVALKIQSEAQKIQEDELKKLKEKTKQERRQTQDTLSQYQQSLQQINSQSKPMWAFFPNIENQFAGSTIITADEDKSFLLYHLFFVDMKSFSTNLLYKASQHGFTAQDFHEMCDNKRATIVIIRTTNNRIFGGYTTQPWDKNMNDYVEDTQSFLFSLDHKAKYSLIPGNESYAISSHCDYGPTFGNGNDLFCGTTFNSNENGSAMNYTYRIPNDEDCSTILAGESQFTISEMEVYEVI